MKKSDIARITDIEDNTYFDLCETCKMYHLTVCDVLEYIDNNKFYLKEEYFDDSKHCVLFFNQYYCKAIAHGVYGMISIDEVTEVDYE